LFYWIKKKQKFKHNNKSLSTITKVQTKETKVMDNNNTKVKGWADLPNANSAIDLKPGSPKPYPIRFEMRSIESFLRVCASVLFRIKTTKILF
jgi:hypothetical protein